MSVKFEDYSVQVTNALEDSAEQFLIAASMLVRNAAQDGSEGPYATGDLKGSWDYRIDNSAQTATIGSPKQHAIYNEFGTGEYAENGKGGPGGYWVYVKGGSGSRTTGKRYSLEEAKQVMAILRSKGLEAYYTKGQKPKRTLQKAFTKNKKKIIRLADKIFGERMN